MRNQYRPSVEKVEDEYYITIQHDMSKKHYISFIAAVKDDGYEIKKLYAEGNAEAHTKGFIPRCGL